MNSNSSWSVRDCVGPVFDPVKPSESSAIAGALCKTSRASLDLAGSKTRPHTFKIRLPKVLPCIELPNPTDGFQKA